MCFQIFNFMQTWVRLHYVDNIFYVMKLCICWYNAMVLHFIENWEDPETEDMCNVTSNNKNALELDEEEVKDNTQIDIKAEDNFCSKAAQTKSK